MRKGMPMLILTRKEGQSVVIGEDVTVTVMEIKGDGVRLAFRAPANVEIGRFEVRQSVREVGRLTPHGSGQ